MKAHLRQIRISPKKANLVAGMVRGKKVSDALALLKFMPKKGADIIYKIVHSAASNAKNNFKQSIDDLYITQILVTKGPTYKRSLPISRGRVHPIRKRTSHITVEVGLPEGKEPATPVKEEKAKKPAKAEKTEKPKNETAEKTSTKKTTKKAT
jgi:large subunit ribosomal protein L22